MTGTFNFYKNTNLSKDEDTVLHSEISSYLSSRKIGTRTAQMYTRTSEGAGKARIDITNSNAATRILEADLLHMDYLTLIDPAYGNKLFYCFVTKVEYISDAVRDIYFEEDSFHTWHDDFSTNENLNGSHIVERETVNNDAIFTHPEEDLGANAENIARGTYNLTFVNEDEAASHKNVSTDVEYMVLALAGFYNVVGEEATFIPYNNYPTAPYHAYSMHDGVPDDRIYYVGKAQSHATTLGKIISDLTKKPFIGDSKAQAIVGFYSVPAAALPSGVVAYLNSESSGICIMCPSLSASPTVSNIVKFDYQGNCSVSTWNDRVKRPATGGKFGDGYITRGALTSAAFGLHTVKNNKLFQYPYSFIRVKNNAGEYKDLDARRLKNYPLSGAISTDRFKLEGRCVMADGCHIDALPGYDDTDANTTYRISTQSFPDVTFVSENYNPANSLRNISGSIGVVSTAIVAGVKGAAAGGPLGAIAGAGVAGLAGFANSNFKTSEEARYNANNGNTALTGQGFNKITYTIFGLTEADARVIDDAFTKYGYAMNKSKVVSLGLNSRPHFHYFKTNQCHLVGNVPQYARQNIQGRFDGGIRIWKSTSFLDYSKDNSIN